jgi:hypothetical protein
LPDFAIDNEDDMPIAGIISLMTWTTLLVTVLLAKAMLELSGAGVGCGELEVANDEVLG